MEWADSLVWRDVLAHPAAVHDARVRDLLLHLHGVQRAFLAMWTEEPQDPSASDAGTHDLVTAEQAVRAYYRELHTALASFDEATLRRSIVIPGLEPYEHQMGRRFDQPTAAETMLHVAGHSTSTEVR